MSQEKKNDKTIIGMSVALGTAFGVLSTIAIGRYIQSLQRNRKEQIATNTNGLIPFTLVQDAVVSEMHHHPCSNEQNNPNSSKTSSGTIDDNEPDSISDILSSQAPFYEGKHATIKFERIDESIALQRSQDVLTFMNMRRSIRFFSKQKFNINILKNCLLTAGTAPSGAHCQPWHFVIVESSEAKMKIRHLVEKEEQINYDRRMRESWVNDVSSIVGNLHGVDTKKGDKIKKPYLSDAPYLVIVMLQKYGIHPKTGGRYDHHYARESVGISCGMLIGALHNCNLATLTSTPMGAEKGIREICKRPENEKVYLLMPVGYPCGGATVPYRTAKLLRKPESEIISVV